MSLAIKNGHHHNFLGDVHFEFYCFINTMIISDINCL